MTTRDEKRPMMRTLSLLLGSFMVIQYDGFLFVLGIVLLLALIADLINPG